MIRPSSYVQININSLLIKHEENTKEIIGVMESVCRVSQNNPKTIEIDCC